MILAYLDESGTHDQAKIVVMAGFLASYGTWRKFEKRWQRVLNPDGGKRVFHATDCLGRDGHGDFDGWPKKERDDLVNGLIPVLKKHSRASFACAFSVQDYEEVVPEWIRRKWQHPYYVCMFTVLNAIYINRAKLPPLGREKIAFVFARKPKFVGLLTDLYDSLKYSGVLFRDILGKMTADGTPEDDIPIQAADLFGYLVRTFHEKDYFQRDSAHPRTIDLINRLKLKNHLLPDFLNRDALRLFARTYAETYDEVGAWEWNAKKRS
jgi:hypothetical protein